MNEYINIFALICFGLLMIYIISQILQFYSMNISGLGMYIAFALFLYLSTWILPKSFSPKNFKD